MSRVRFAWLSPAAVCLGVGVSILALCGGAGAEVVQLGQLRASFDTKLTPQALPRSESVPVDVSMRGRISAVGGGIAPQLQRITIKISRVARIAPGSLPACRIEEIQPATTAGALEACGRSLVGEGSFSASVLLPDQTPFPSQGKVHAFNGSYRGHRAILAHVYGTRPAPTSYTLPFLIRESKGTYGTVLSASLPAVTSEWGYVTGLSLELSGTGPHDGFLRASCPAPRGFTTAVFPLAHTTLAFAGGKSLSATLDRWCRVR